MSNNNLHDGLGFGPECSAEPERFNLGDYLDFLETHGHNFIRLWRWEQFKGQLPMAGVHCCMTPQPWPRTGPGAATDGKPKGDLDRFDTGFFDRLRERVVAAGERGHLHLSDAVRGFQSAPQYAPFQGDALCAWKSSCAGTTRSTTTSGSWAVRNRPT